MPLSFRSLLATCQGFQIVYHLFIYLFILGVAETERQQQLNRGSGGNVVEMKAQTNAASAISFTDQVLNLKEFSSLIQPEGTGPSNTTQQPGIYT